MQQKVAVKQRANDCSYSDTCGASGETLSLKPFLHTRLLGFNKSFIECFKNLKLFNWHTNIINCSYLILLIRSVKSEKWFWCLYLKLGTLQSFKKSALKTFSCGSQNQFGSTLQFLGSKKSPVYFVLLQ